MNAEIWETLKARKLGLGTPILEVLIGKFASAGCHAHKRPYAHHKT